MRPYIPSMLLNRILCQLTVHSSSLTLNPESGFFCSMYEKEWAKYAKCSYANAPIRLGAETLVSYDIIISSTFRKKLLAVWHTEYVCFTVYTRPCKPSSKNTGNFFNQYNKRKSTYGKISVQGCPLIVSVFYPPSKTSSALWDLRFLFLEQLWNSKIPEPTRAPKLFKINNLRAHVSRLVLHLMWNAMFWWWV